MLTLGSTCMKTGTSCPTTTPVPVLRRFRAVVPRGHAPNHRYTVSQVSYERMATVSWTQESIAFCVSSATDARTVYRLSYLQGKNRFTTAVDCEAREYYVRVPAGHNPLPPTSVVFMLHGSGSDRKKFYDPSECVQIGETNNLLTIFPSSWAYKSVSRRH